MLVVTLGDLLLDVIVRLGEPLASGADALAPTQTAAGGQAANVAAWAVALGAEARCISTMAWFSNMVHPSFTHINRPERFADDPATHPNIKETGRKNFWANLQEIDAMLKGKDWMIGTQYTVCDPYVLVFYGWGVRINLPMKELAAYTAFKDRMLQRPAVRHVAEKEKLAIARDLPKTAASA